MEKYDADEHLENPGIRQVKDAKIIADEDSRQRADDDNPHKGPCHAAFLEMAIHAARDGNDMVDKIGGTQRWRGKTKNAYVKGQEMNAPETPAIEVSDDTTSAANGGRNIHVLTPDCGINR